MNKPSFIPVASSQIEAVAYTPEAQTLYLVFKPKGSVYRYFGFPQEKFDQLIDPKNPSIGKFFGAHIKGQDKNNPLYPFERVAEGKEGFEKWWQVQCARHGEGELL